MIRKSPFDVIEGFDNETDRRNFVHKTKKVETDLSGTVDFMSAVDKHLTSPTRKKAHGNDFVSRRIPNVEGLEHLTERQKETKGLTVNWYRL